MFSRLSRYRTLPDVVTTDEEPYVGPLTEEALRYEAQADRKGS